MVTVEQLKKVYTQAPAARLERFVPHINRHMVPVGDITTVLRARHFIAQIGHESGCFRYVLELATGKAYEGRSDLGNTQPGDGVKFKGRGLIQITGRNNYNRCSMGLWGDLRLLDTPELLEEPENAVRSALWFWRNRGLNSLADRDDIRAVTLRINGGYNGLEHRIQLYELAKKHISW